MDVAPLRRMLWLTAVAGLPACGDYDGGEVLPPGERGPLQPRIESIQQQVFAPHCTSCHAGGNPSGAMGLDDAQTSYDNLVGVRAAEFPLRFRVEAGNPDDSYLIHKLEGSQAVGARMPLNQAPLSPEVIAVIREWIADGAPPPGAEETPLLP